MTQIANATTVNVEMNRERALDLRAEGFTYQEIGVKLELSKTRAYELVREALDELREDNNIRAAHLRDLELRRLDKIRLSLWDNRGKPDVAAVLVRLSARVSDLLGLDAPKKIEQSGPDGGPIRFDGGRVQLTDSERQRRLQDIGLSGLLPAFIAPNGNSDDRKN